MSDAMTSYGSNNGALEIPSQCCRLSCKEAPTHLLVLSGGGTVIFGCQPHVDEWVWLQHETEPELPLRPYNGQYPANA